MLGGIGFSGYALDEPLPDLSGNSARMSAPPSYVKLARQENLTLRQTAKRAVAGRAHFMVKGTVKQVVDELEHWFTGGAADGFNLLPQWLPGALNDFVDKIVPELQRRGLFRTEYEGATLRENLGLAIPKNAHTQARQQN